MKPIEDIFFLHRARSGLYRDYQSGKVPYIGNGLVNNAVNGLVLPREQDKVFQCRAVVVSAFCEATVQVPPFVACGRAGNGLVVLEPRKPMAIRQLGYIAAYINLAVRWRFNWYRQTTVDRLRRIEIPSTVPAEMTYDVAAALPPTSVKPRSPWRASLAPFSLGSLYTIEPGDFHSFAELAPGRVPVVSCGDRDNGVSGYFDVPEDKIHKNRMTVAFNGMNTLTAKYHPYRFGAKDDVAVCVPKVKLKLTTELFIQMMINRERWRYSYYRKCFAEKLRQFQVSLPAKQGRIDEDTIQLVMESSPYWSYVKEHGEKS